MKSKFILKDIDLTTILSFFGPLILFWAVLSVKLPYFLTQYFSDFSFSLFVITLILYYLSFRLPGRVRFPAAFGLTMLLFALTLSYKWTSGYSDNKIIGGLLPYKDGASYYQGASLILNGFSLSGTVQAAWRPLFSGFLASLLLLTGVDLKTSLAILVLIAGIGSYSSSRQIFNSFGPLAAGLFSTFLYFYMQPLIGLTMTELLGFALGCFAFSIFWRASDHLRLLDLALGTITLVAALSVRAGAFFILPLLALWAGWILRENKNFSIKGFAVITITALASFILLNSLYVRLVGIPSGTAYGNFAYSLYGQVRGGIGWHAGISDLGTPKPSVIYRAAFNYFLNHPLGFFVGSVKAYRDFFLPVGTGIFMFGQGQSDWLTYVFWGLATALLIWGSFGSIKSIGLNNSSLLIAVFVGMFFSIPFLPPIDGGTRFYASTIPFFFALPTVAVGRWPVVFEQNEGLAETSRLESIFLRFAVPTLLMLTAVVPLMILNLSSHPSSNGLSCPSGQDLFSLRTNPDSYVDLISGTSTCGLSPEICFNDFQKNGVEKNVDDFYQELVSLTDASGGSVRIIPDINLRDGKFHYFLIPYQEISPVPSHTVISGCALEIKTKSQSIYLVDSFINLNKGGN